MAKLKDFYGELGVAPSSEDFVIQAAYRAMLKRYHPDVNRSADAARKTMRINEAYKVLSDAETRARYDRALKASRKSKESASSKNSYGSSGSTHQKERPRAEEAPPPPPPVEPVYAGPVATNPDLSWGRKVSFMFFGVAAVLFVIYTAAHTGPGVAQVDENLNAPMTAFEPEENMSVDAVPPSLGTQDAPQVDFGTIEAAAKKYSKTLFSTGIIGARQYSEKCHKAALETPTWTAFDQCAAFDYAAAHIDEQVSGPTGTKNSYFQFQTDNMQRFYTSAGAEPVALYSRLSDIEKYAGQAAEEAVEADIAKQNAAEEARRAREETENAVDNSIAATADAASSDNQSPNVRSSDQLWVDDVLNRR